MSARLRALVIWVLALVVVVIGSLYWLANLSHGLPPPVWEIMPICGVTPNCVTSNPASNATASFHVAPIPYEGDRVAALERLRTVLHATPGLRFVHVGSRTIQARVHSNLFGFVDDLFFRIDDGDKGGLIHCYSASRVGHWDFGMNRRRLERIATQFAARSVTDAPPPPKPTALERVPERIPLTAADALNATSGGSSPGP